MRAPFLEIAKLLLRECFAISRAGDCAHCARDPPAFPMASPAAAACPRGRKLGEAGSDLLANRCRVRALPPQWH